MTVAVYHMDSSHSRGQPLPPSDNSVEVKRHMFRTTSELKRELKKLVYLVTKEEEEGEECRAELYEEICENAQALKGHKCGKAQAATVSKCISFSEQLDSIPVPDCFTCPISSELMRDPVILATGQTYDRQFIQAWLDAGHCTCPKTQQVLPNLTLTPNYLVRTMIEQWCEWHGLELQSPTKVPNTIANGNASIGNGITQQERKYATVLVAKLSDKKERQSQQREAARELRALTRKRSSHRAYLAQETEAIPALIPLLLSLDSETQEHAVTTLLNLSIHDANKKAIVEEGAMQPIVEVLRNGGMPARENAAAALFSLSAIEDNKVVIGASGAIPALVALLREGNRRGKTDAASALFNLCICQGNRGRCVRAGMVPILLKLMMNNGEEEGMADEALAILAIIAGNEEGFKAIGDGGALPLLMHYVKHSSPRNKENAAVILFEMCSRDHAYLEGVKNSDGYMALLHLTTSGTSRARRKANALLQWIRNTNGEWNGMG